MIGYVCLRRAQAQTFLQLPATVAIRQSTLDSVPSTDWYCFGDETNRKTYTFASRKPPHKKNTVPCQILEDQKTSQNMFSPP